MHSGNLSTPWRSHAWTGQTHAATRAANQGPTDEDYDEDWDACDPDPASDEFLDLGEPDDEDEPLPEDGDFWQDPDEFEDEGGA
jgi:hypothetical protein